MEEYGLSMLQTLRGVREDSTEKLAKCYEKQGSYGLAKAVREFKKALDRFESAVNVVDYATCGKCSRRFDLKDTEYSYVNKYGDCVRCEDISRDVIN